MIEEKTKFLIVIFAMVALLVTSLFVNFQTYNSKITAEREKSDLKNENTSLGMKLEAFQKDKQQLESKLGALNEDLNKIIQQKDEIQGQREELQKQYDILVKERDELLERMQSQPQLQSQVAKAASVSALTASATPTEEAYWAGVLKEKTEQAAQLENMRNEFKTVQTNNEQLKTEKSALELDLNSLIREKKDLEQQLASLDSMSLELVREKNMKLKIQEDLRSIKRENTILRQQLKELNKSKGLLENKLQQVQEERSVLDRRFNEMSALLENRLSQMGGLKQRLDALKTEEPASQVNMLDGKESVELPPIIVRTPAEEGSLLQEQAQESTQASGLAKILSVNRENNFVIIDLGEDAGIRIGDRLQVYRQGQRIASLEVIQTRQSISACDIKDEILAVKTGDIIR